MKKLFKWLFRLIIVVVVLIVAVIIALPLIFDPNDHKERIQTLVQDNIGRNVKLNGEIGWSIFPVLALEFKDVEVANEQGFKGEYLAKIGSVAAQVQVLPLLKKDIQIGQVSLNQPQINLQVSNTGKNNWQSIIDNVSADKDTSNQDQTASSGSLEIRGISIEQATLSYTNKQDPLSAEISQFDFAIDVISADKQSETNADFRLQIPASGLDAQITTQALLSNLVSGSGIIAQIESLTIDGKLTAESDVDFELSLEQPGNLDLAKDTLDLPEVALSFANLQLSTNVKGSQISQDMKLSGSMTAPQFDLAQLLQQMQAPLNNQANNQVTVASDWSLGNNRLQLEKLKLTLDQSTLTGAVDLQQLDRLKGTFSIAIDQINLDQYIPGGDGEDASQTVEQGNYNFGYLDGKINIASLQASGAKLENITLSLVSNGTGFSVKPLRADFYQGALNTQLTVDTVAAKEKVKISHEMSEIKAGPLLTDLIGEKYLTGLGNLDASVSIDEPFSAKPLTTANGTISYRLSDGALYGMDIFGMMRQGLSLIDSSGNQEDSGEKKTDFALMQIDALVENGILKTQQLSVTSPYFELNGQVEINLDEQTIKGSIAPKLINIPENVLGPEYKKLLNVAIPVSLNGSLLEPSISIDVKQLILESQKEKIEEKKDELKNKLFDKLLGDDKKDEETKDPSQSSSAPDTNTDPAAKKEKKQSTEDKIKGKLLESLLGGDKKDEPDDSPDDPDGNLTP